MYKIYLTIMLSVALSAEVVGGVAVVVQGSPITIYDIKKEMRISHADSQTVTNMLIRKTLEQQEIKKRRISVKSSEVYDDIKETAKRNNLSVNEFYEAIQNSNGLSSAELKEKIKEKLLSQKLYAAIAYSSVTQPTDEEIEAYFESHKENFTHSSGFNVVIYSSKNRARLQEKIDNPMFHSPDITTNEQNLPYARISPELASLLEKTPTSTFTPIVPNAENGFMSFYVKEKEAAQESTLESVKNQILNKIMSEQREQVLGDYFARLRHNADIKMIRTVE